MGIYIKDMKMPKNCGDCIFCVNNWCVINSRLHHIKGAEETTQYCPLVEVVMCKDCKFLEMGQNESDSWRYCRMTKGNVADSDFCSYGERKINDIL